MIQTASLSHTKPKATSRMQAGEGQSSDFARRPVDQGSCEPNFSETFIPNYFPCSPNIDSLCNPLRLFDDAGLLHDQFLAMMVKHPDRKLSGHRPDVDQSLPQQQVKIKPKHELHETLSCVWNLQGLMRKDAGRKQTKIEDNRPVFLRLSNFHGMKPKTEEDLRREVEEQEGKRDFWRRHWQQLQASELKPGDVFDTQVKSRVLLDQEGQTK